jgi:hypothetical protein
MGWAPCTSPFTVDVGSGVAHFVVRAVDAAKNRGKTDEVIWTIDGDPPSLEARATWSKDTTGGAAGTNSSAAGGAVDRWARLEAAAADQHGIPAPLQTTQGHRGVVKVTLTAAGCADAGGDSAASLDDGTSSVVESTYGSVTVARLPFDVVEVGQLEAGGSVVVTAALTDLPDAQAATLTLCSPSGEVLFTVASFEKGTTAAGKVVAASAVWDNIPVDHSRMLAAGSLTAELRAGGKSSAAGSRVGADQQGESACIARNNRPLKLLFSAFFEFYPTLSLERPSPDGR